MDNESNFSVLIIDDDPSFRQLARWALEARGIQVVEAATGKEALKAAHQKSFDLLSVDGLLPDFTGIDWIRKLRSFATHETTPVVFISSMWIDETLYNQLTGELKITQVIHKPIVPMAFAEQILGLLQRKELKNAVAQLKNRVSSAMGQLTARYISELPDRFAELKAAIDGSKSDNDLSADAISYAHKIRGTAGSFALQHLGNVAGEIEDTFRMAPEASMKDAQFWTNIEMLFNKAHSMIPQPAKTAMSASDVLPVGDTTQPPLAKVLIMDDDAMCTQAVRIILQEHRIETFMLNEPVRILETMEKINPDLLLLDIMMPGISGLDVCKMLRTLPRWKDIPIIFLTAETSLDTRAVAFQAGGNDYIPKPFAEEELLARVKSILEQAGLLKARSGLMH